MKRMIGFIVLLAGVSVLQLGLAQVPAGAPAGATGLCNDGTYSTAASKSGACRGHKGIKTWYAAPDATKSKTSAGKAASTSAPAAALRPLQQRSPHRPRPPARLLRLHPRRRRGPLACPLLAAARSSLAQYSEQCLPLPRFAMVRQDQGRSLHDGR